MTSWAKSITDAYVDRDALVEALATPDDVRVTYHYFSKTPAHV
jgi:hypothetical protein